MSWRGLIRGIMLIRFTLCMNLIDNFGEIMGLAFQLACLQGFRDTIRLRLWAGSVVTRMVPSQR